MRNHIGVVRQITDTCLYNQENLEVYFHQQNETDLLSMTSVFLFDVYKLRNIVHEFDVCPS